MEDLWRLRPQCFSYRFEIARYGFMSGWSTKAFMPLAIAVVLRRNMDVFNNVMNDKIDYARYTVLKSCISSVLMLQRLLDYTEIKTIAHEVDDRR
jgi:hypothetical protein